MEDCAKPGSSATDDRCPVFCANARQEIGTVPATRYSIISPPLNFQTHCGAANMLCDACHCLKRKSEPPDEFSVPTLEGNPNAADLSRGMRDRSPR